VCVCVSMHYEKSKINILKCIIKILRARTPPPPPPPPPRHMVGTPYLLNRAQRIVVVVVVIIIIIIITPTDTPRDPPPSSSSPNLSSFPLCPDYCARVCVRIFICIIYIYIFIYNTHVHTYTLICIICFHPRRHRCCSVPLARVYTSIRCVKPTVLTIDRFPPPAV